MGLALHSFSQALRLLAKRREMTTPPVLGFILSRVGFRHSYQTVAVLFFIAYTPRGLRYYLHPGTATGRKRPARRVRENFFENATSLRSQCPVSLFWGVRVKTLPREFSGPLTGR